MYTSRLKARTSRLIVAVVVVAILAAIWVTPALAGGGYWSG